MRFAPAVLVAAIIFILSSRTFEVPLSSWQSIAVSVAAHLLLFAALGFTVAYALAPRIPDRAKLIRRTVAAVLVYGIGDEIHQRFVPSRSMSVLDLIPDLIGGLAGAWGYVRLSSRRRAAARR